VDLGLVVRIVVAAGVFWLIWKAGRVLLGGLARPVPAPPPAGELRRVKIVFSCPICSTEVRMTRANDEMPQPPRHCMEDMELVTPADDL
jgi:hypothetical protein